MRCGQKLNCVCTGSVDVGRRRTTQLHRGWNVRQEEQLRKLCGRDSPCHHLPDGSKATAEFVDSANLARLLSLLQCCTTVQRSERPGFAACAALSHPCWADPGQGKRTMKPCEVWCPQSGHASNAEHATRLAAHWMGPAFKAYGLSLVTQVCSLDLERLLRHSSLRNAKLDMFKPLMRSRSSCRFMCEQAKKAQEPVVCVRCRG